MKKVLKIVAITPFVLVFGYILLPSPAFPEPLPDALQSKEPADSETPLRRAYFTNLTREEVMTHYRKEFLGYCLNYPPEESRTLIRDQTRSTFLEEIVHPLRESIYVNGFEPKDPHDAINIEGRPWRQKVIIRYVPSSVLVRIVVLGLTSFLAVVLVKEFFKKK